MVLSTKIFVRPQASKLMHFLFRPKSGTNIACSGLIEELRVVADEGKHKLILFMDLSAGFDTVNHSVLVTG